MVMKKFYKALSYICLALFLAGMIYMWTHLNAFSPRIVIIPGISSVAFLGLANNKPKPKPEYKPEEKPKGKSKKKKK